MSTLKIRENSSSPWQSIPTGGVGVPAGGTTNQFLTKSSNVDYATQWSTVTPATIGAMAEWDLLWENASPTSSFSSQTIPMDLSAYDVVAIAYGIFNDSDGAIKFAFAIVDSPFNSGKAFMDGAFAYAGSRNVRRYFVASSTGVDIQAGYYNTGDNATACVPYRIYGIKGVHSS